MTSPSLFLSPSGVLGPQVEELPVRTESGQYSPCLSAARDPSCLCRAIAEMMNERGRGLIRSSDSSGSGGKKGREGDLKKKKRKSRPRFSGFRAVRAGHTSSLSLPPALTVSQTQREPPPWRQRGEPGCLPGPERPQWSQRSRCPSLPGIRIFKSAILGRDDPTILNVTTARGQTIHHR